MNQLIEEIFENYGWSAKEYKGEDEHEGEIEIENWSPAGEDLIETLEYDGTDDSLLNSLKQMRDNFDEDEHVKMWVQSMDSVSGVPQSIRALVEDAEQIKEMYNDLYFAFYEALSQ